MTEYGQGAGPQPWHGSSGEDPLYGDGWDGQQGPYQNGDPYAAQQGYDPYGQQQAYDQHGQHGYPQPQPQPQGYGAQQGYAPQQPQQQGYYPGAQGGWDTGTGQIPAYGQGGAGYGGPGTDPYGMAPVDAYGTGTQPAVDSYATGPQQVQQPYQGGYAPQGYDTGGYPQQAQPQAGPMATQPMPVVPGPAGPGPGESRGPSDPYGPGTGTMDPVSDGPGPDPDTGWDPGPDQGEHAFFTGEGDEEDEDDGRRTRRGRREGAGAPEGKKKRSGCAVAAASVVLVGGLGGAAYAGYGFYESHFASAPDYPGSGSGQAQVTVPDGSTIAQMGEVLQKAGVVKSPGAFVEAASANHKASNIQPGNYSLKRKMSGRAAVDLMLSPASQNALIIPEGSRAAKVYELVDKKLGAKPGTTAAAAKQGGLGLPAWAKNKPEGFLFPSRYSFGTKTAPAQVLQQMVQRAKSEQAKDGLPAAAKKVGRTPEEILVIASLIQAEAQQPGDFGKVSRVIYNRLDQNMLLGFDSTINYAKGRSSLNTSVQDTHVDSPYNTYMHHGLPPGPIDNPGHQAIEAALNPTKGNWLYFVTVKPGDTRFTASKAQHDRNVAAFNREQRKNGSGG